MYASAEKLYSFSINQKSTAWVGNKSSDTETKEVLHTTNEIQAEAVQALVALGYASAESMKAVKKVPLTDDMAVEDVLKQALKNMMFW